MRPRRRIKAPPIRKKKFKYKSKLESAFAELLSKNGVQATYEARRFEFVRMAHYLPDWEVTPTLYIETKGYFSPRNRGDLLSFREQHPGVEIFLVFEEPRNRLSSKSKTTYSEWCEKHGFRWSSIDKFPKHLWEKQQ
jgi:hypothetical protein